MNKAGIVNRASEWCYHGVWGVLTKLFLVPDQPPNLPSFHGEAIEYHRPSPAFLAYRKFFFWIGLFIIDVVLVILWIAFSIWSPLWGLLTAPIWLVVIVAPDVLAYIAIHLAYDTTWYVLSDRSMRIRRGIWTIRETTITFENIQNVNIVQGPFQRWFGFSNLSVSTAGGGGSAHGEATSMSFHHGWIEGIDHAEELRTRILAKSQHTAGLGDDHPSSASSPSPNMGSSLQQVDLLREIRELTAQLNQGMS
jgi:membrane protein YdbS with pleckstrin-like domain